MKKILVLIAMALGSCAIVGCSNCSTSAGNENDSVFVDSVEVDSVVIDSISFDSIA